MSQLTLNEVASINTPATSKAGLYVDSVDHRLKMKLADGSIVVLSPFSIFENTLINGGHTFAQRQAPGTLTAYSNTSGRSYAADRWGITNENASVQYQRVDTQVPETGLAARYYGKYKKITSGGKMVISQVIEGSNVMPLRGRKVRFQAKMKFTVAASMTVRMALFQLTSAGTIDTIPATFISAFGAVGTDPTFGANISAITPLLTETTGSISGNGITCVLSSAWQRFSATFTVPTNCLNLIAVIFTNGQPAVNDELNISEVGLFDGEEIQDWSRDLVSTELAKCQRYYCKTFPVDTLPAQTGGVGNTLRGGVAIALAVTTSSAIQWRFPVSMFKAPTIVFFNPSAANAFLRNIARGTDATATSSANVTTDSADVNATGLAAWTVGDEIKVCATADAEL